MASRKFRTSVSKSKIASKEPEANVRTVSNAFVNDGSFLELYKKKMEEVERAKKPIVKETSSGVEAEGEGQKSADEAKTDGTINENDSKTQPSEATSLLQGKRKLLTGRMGGAKKQLNAKKKKEEKQAAQEKGQGSKDEGKNSAWNAYMEEVKRYRETTCSEEVDRIRPLVK